MGCFPRRAVSLLVGALLLVVGARAERADGDVERELGLLKDLLGFELDGECTSKRENYYYRSYSGFCNWLKPNETEWGGYGTPLSRDVLQNSYEDGISKPREGPSPRELSNIFFRRKEKLFYEHTPVLLGLVEFVIHDLVTTGRSKGENMEIPVPKCDEFFDPECHGNKTINMWRTTPVPGTGTSFSNPREVMNMGSTWLDLSPLYGHSEELCRRLREPTGCRMKMSKGPDGGDYPPFNDNTVPMNGWDRAGHRLFQGGDPRSNQDWLLMAVHTLLLREHNRLCDIVTKDHPTWDDDKLFEYTRHLTIAHYNLGLNQYQSAYFTSEMSYPEEDGFGLSRAWYNQSILFVHPFHPYPLPSSLVNGKPLVSSQEMAIGYRFHDLIPETIPVIDNNGTVRHVNLAATTFDADGFLTEGIDNVLRGMASVSIPNFHSGVAEDFRSGRISYAVPQEGKGYDIVAFTIAQERERGLPTFNDYFRRYTGKPPVRIREKFEDFTSDPHFVAELRRLYKSPDHVDLMVGLQLDEEYFPGTTVPRGMLITSLFSLLGVGNSDRFSILYSAPFCMITQKPWDCTPLNPVDEMLWEPFPLPFFPRARWGGKWFKELDVDNAGVYSIWNIITKNSNVKCLQINPLFPVDPLTNPVVCSLPKKAWSLPVATAAVVATVVILSAIAQLFSKK